MLDKLDAIKGRFDNLGVALTNPEIVSDNKKFAATSKEYRSLEKIVNARNEYVKLLDDIEFNKEVLSGDDEEMRSLAKMELPALEEKKRSWKSNCATCLFQKILTMKKMPSWRYVPAPVAMKLLYLRATC